MTLDLSIALTNNPRTWPVLDGRVKARRHRSHDQPCRPVRDVLAPAPLRRVRRVGDVDVVADDGQEQGRRALGRRARLHHAALLPHRHPGAARRASIDQPADLKGKRVGVPEYQQTAALWARGVLQHEFGVKAQDMEFWMERPPERSHGGATGFTPPPGVTLALHPAEKNIGSMMVSGELHAALHVFRAMASTSIDRSSVDLREPSRHQAALPRSRSPRACAITPRPASIRSITAWS